MWLARPLLDVVVHAVADDDELPVHLTMSEAIVGCLRDAVAVAVSQCDSMPRYALAALPAWVVLGTVLAQSRHRRPLLFASVLVMAFQTFIVVAGRAVP